MRALVTGATGFIGGAVARELLAHGWEVRCLARPAADLTNLEGLDAELARGDVRERPAVAAAVQGCDAVFHVAALYSFDPRQRRAIHDVNVGGTLNVLECARAAGVCRVVYTSTSGTIGLRHDRRPAGEGEPLTPAHLVNDYKRSKYQAEQQALRLARGGLDVVIVNPTAPVGPGDVKPTPTGMVLVRFLRRQMPAYADTGLNIVDVADVAAGHRLAFEQGRSGERYILGNRNLALAELLRLLAGLTGLPAPRLKSPYWMSWLAAALSEAVQARLLRRAPALTLGEVRMSRWHMFYDASKAVRELGLPQSPVEDALCRAVEWFVQRGYAPRPPRVGRQMRAPDKTNAPA
ncbi:MAG: NAD-dependent epimerase/dehydratase family protein [Chloroflexi bacterium]|nr:NAD-dependent epimerase/dehydratase family protein [Chloroflexota bacterium]